MEVGRLWTRVGADTTDLARGLNSARGLATAWARDVQGQFNSVQASLARGFTGGLGMAAGFAGIQGMAGMLDGVKSAAIGFNSTMQMSEIAFEKFTGNAERATGFLEQLKETAATTSFEFPDLLKGTRLLAGAGMQAERLIPFMKDIATLGQASGLGSAEIGPVNRAFSQIQAKGRVMSEELMQLASAGVPALKLLADYTDRFGGDMAKAQRAVETGTVSVNELFNAIHKAAQDPRMVEMADKMNKSWSVAASNVRDRLRYLIADGFHPAFEGATMLANKLATFLDSKPVKDFAAGFASTLSDLGNNVMIPFGQRMQDMWKQATSPDFAGKNPIAMFLGMVLAEANAFASRMLGAGYNVISSFAQGMIQGGNTLVTSAAQFVANIVAGFLMGSSPPDMPPLSEIMSGGAAVTTAWAEGILTGGSGAAAAAREVAVGVKNEFGEITRTMSAAQGWEGLRTAAGNMGALKEQANLADDAMRGLTERQRGLQDQSKTLSNAHRDIKDAFDAQIDPLREQLELMRSQNDLAERHADLQDRITDAALNAAMTAAKGDTVERAKKQAALDTLNHSQEILRNEIRGMELATKGLSGDKEKERAAKAIADKQAELNKLELQETGIRGELLGMVDKVALAEATRNKAVADAQQEQRKISEDGAKLAREAIEQNTEAEIRAREKARDATLKPIEEAQEATRQSTDIVTDQIQEWQALNGAIRDVMATQQAKEAAEKAAAAAEKKAAKERGIGGVPLDPTMWQDIPAIAKKKGEETAASFRAGMMTYFQAHQTEILLGGLGGLAGGAIGGPAGALLGSVFMTRFGAELEARVPGAFGILGRGITTFLQALAGDWELGPGIEDFAARMGTAGLQVRDFATQIQSAWTSLQPTLQSLGRVMMDTFTTIGQALAGNWNPDATIHPFVNAIGQLAVVAGTVGNALWRAFNDQIIPAFSNAMAVIGPAINGTILPALQRFGDWFAANLPTVIAGIEGLDWARLGQGAATFGQFIESDVIPAGERFVAWFRNDLPTIINFVADNVLPKLITAFRFLSDNFSTIVPLAIGAFATFKVFEGVIAIGRGIYHFAQAIWGFSEAVGVIKTAATLLLSPFQKLLPIIPALATGFSSLATFVSLVGGAFAAGGMSAGIAAFLALMNPVGVAIGALVVAGALLAVAWTQNWGDIQGKTAAVVDWLTNTAWPAIQGGAQWLIDQWNNVLYPAISQLGPVFEAAGTFAKAAWDTFVGVVMSAVQTEVETWKARWELAQLIWETFWNVLAPHATAAWNGIVSWFTGAFNAWKADWDADWLAVSTFFKEKWDGLVGIATAGWNALLAWSEPARTGWKADWDADWKLISDTFKGVWDGLMAAAKPPWDALMLWFNEQLAKVKQSWDTMWLGLPDTVKKFITLALQALGPFGAQVAKMLGGGAPGATATGIGGAYTGGGTDSPWFEKAMTSARQYNVDPAIFVSQIFQESGFNPAALNKVSGARGIAQFMPGTAAGVAKQLGVTIEQFWDSTELQLQGAALHMQDLLQQYGGDYDKALAAYNAGPGAVQQYGGVPPFAETQEYIRAIRSRVGAAPAGQRGPLTLDTSQFQLGLSPQAAANACGPYAAMLFAQSFGRYPTAEEATSLASAYGWTPGQGMTNASQFGPMVNEFLRSQGIQGRIAPDVTPSSEEAAAALAGGPVAFSTPDHYFVADQFDPNTQAFRVGATGTIMPGGKEWMTYAEILRAGGNLIYSTWSLMGQGGPAAAGENPLVVQAQQVEASLARAQAAFMAFHGFDFDQEDVTDAFAMGKIQPAIAAVQNDVANAVTSGMTLQKLQSTLIEMAARSGLAEAPSEAVSQGWNTLDQAMVRLLDHVADLSPAGAALRDEWSAGGMSQEKLALSILTLLGLWKQVPAVAAEATTAAATAATAATTAATTTTATTAAAPAALGDVSAQSVAQVAEMQVKMNAQMAALAEDMRTAGQRVGKAIIDGMVQGIHDGTGRIREAVLAMMDEAVNAAEGKEGLDIESPSKKFADMGRQSVMGFVQGVMRNQDRAGHATLEMVRNAAGVRVDPSGVGDRTVSRGDGRRMSGVVKLDGQYLGRWGEQDLRRREGSRLRVGRLR